MNTTTTITPRTGGQILVQQLNNRHRPCNFVELMPRLQEHLTSKAS